MIIPLTPSQLTEYLETVERTGDDSFAYDHFEAIRNHITYLTTQLAAAERLNADYELLTLCAVRYNSIKGYLIPDESIEAILDNEIRGRIKARLADAAMKESPHA